MGISGLLPLLKDAQEDVHISKYKGKVLGVDAYVWLHRGAYGCAQQLALGQHTTRYVDFAMNKVNMLKYHGITPYIVFDGGPLPAKAKTEVERAKRRSDNLKQAQIHLSQGRTQQARDCFVKCVDVTPAMAYQFIKALRLAGVDYIVAPYEADAQLAYLERRGTIDGIITEDSDLLVFGCKTILYKMNDQGHCIELLHQNRNRCKTLQFSTFNDSLFRQMAILSGCDYLDSIPGMGLKTAHRLLKQCGSVARALSAARMEGMRVSPTYQKDFEKAEKTFVYQRVFHKSTTTGKVRMVTLTPCMDQADIDEEDCIGPLLSEGMVSAISLGDMDPVTKELIADHDRSTSTRRTVSAPSAAPAAKSFYAAPKPALSRAASMVGQKTLDTFFSRPRNAAQDVPKKPTSANLAAKRKPLDSITNTAPTSIEPHSVPEEKSKYFTAMACTTTTQSSPVLVQDEAAQLATFTPTQSRRAIRRSMSTDSGEISSPACSSMRTTRKRNSDQLQSSPFLEDSPSTSPTFARLQNGTNRKESLSPIKFELPTVEDSDIEEEEEAGRSNQISQSLFHQFAFQQTPVPKRSSSTSMLKRENSNSTTRSAKRLALSNEEEEDDDDDVFIQQQQTPALHRTASSNVY